MQVVKKDLNIATTINKPQRLTKTSEVNKIQNIEKSERPAQPTVIALSGVMKNVYEILKSYIEFNMEYNIAVAVRKTVSEKKNF